MPAQTGVGVDGYSSNVSAASTHNSSKTSLQDKLLARVAELLDKAGVQVQGSGSLALDLDENGNIEVIGNISNKNEVIAALNGDSKLSQLLSSVEKGAGGTSGGDSGWSQNAYEVELSDAVWAAKNNNAVNADEVPSTTDENATPKVKAAEYTTEITDDGETKYIYEDGSVSITGQDFHAETSKEVIDQMNNYFEWQDAMAATKSDYGYSAFSDIINERIAMISGVLNSNPGATLDNVYETVDGRYVARFDDQSYSQADDSYLMPEPIGQQFGNVDAQLLRQISGALAEAGLTINGSSGVAFGVKDGQVVVSGDNLGNAEEISAVLSQNDAIKSLLSQAQTDIAAVRQVKEKFGNTVTQTNIESIPYDASKPWFTVSYSGRGGQYDNRYGENPNFANVPQNASRAGQSSVNTYQGTTSSSKFNNGSVGADLSQVGRMLGIKDSNPKIDDIVSILKNKSESTQSEKDSLTKQLLSAQGISLSEKDNIALFVGEDGSIIVSAMEGSNISESRINEIQDAINSDPEGASKLAELLKKDSAYRTALTDAEAGTNVFSGTTTQALVEAELGLSLSEAIVNGHFDMTNETVRRFTQENPEITALLSSK